jgi:PAS domain S-box-containing protein
LIHFVIGKDEVKTGEQLMAELRKLRKRVVGLEKNRRERKGREKVLRESEHKFSSFTESIPGMVFQYVLHKDGSSSLLCVNKRIMQYGRISPEAAMAEPSLIFSLIHPDDRETIKEAMAISARTLQDLCVEHRMIDPDGGLRWFSLNSRPRRLSNGDTLFNAVSVEITERKLAEEALRESEARLREIIDLVPHSIFVKDWDGKCLFVNKAVAEVCNKHASALFGENHANVHSNETELQNMLRDDREVIETGEAKFIVEEPFTDARGNLRFMQTTKVPFHLPGNKRRAVLGVAVDITDKKRVEEGLRESEKQFRTVVHDSPNPLFILKEGRFAFLNDAAVQLYGAASKEELLGREIVERVHPDYRAIVLDSIRSAVEEGKQTHLMAQRHTKLDGTIMEVEASSTPIRYQKGDGALVFVRDLSQHKRMEAALREAWLYTRSLIEASLDPLVTVSPDGKITDVNKATEAVTGLYRSSLIGKDFSDCFTDPKKAGAGHLKAMSRGFVKDYQLTIRHASGRLTDVLYNAAVYRSESGEVQGVLAAARDITERKRMVEALRASKAYLDAVIESIPFEFWAIDSDGCYAAQNRICRDRYGDIIGKKPEEVSPNDRILRVWMDNNLRAFAGEVVRGEVRYVSETEKRYFYNVVAPIHDAGRTLGIIGVNVDITDRKVLEAALKKANEELESQVERRTVELSTKNRQLEDINTALEVLLRRREEDKKDLEESLLTNVKGSILPYLEKLKKSHLDENQKTYLGIVESQLDEIISPFLKRLSSRFSNLTPMEIKVAKFVKEGITSKEIAQILGVAEQTILTHRNNLRAKLGLRNEKANLRSYLMSLE